jgi:hypothetical protein
MVMNPLAVKLLAQEWFLAGFAASGRGFHGENYDTVRYPRVLGLLVSQFERIWFDKEEV